MVTEEVKSELESNKGLNNIPKDNFKDMEKTYKD